MVNASIKYLGGIENETFESPEYKTLTGSSTLVKFQSDLKNVTVLIDYGMFQGGRDDINANKEVDEEAIKSDFLVLTHAHLDHSGRVPLLVKNGYKNPIYTTKITAYQAREMLLDYVSIMKEKIEILQSKNSKVENKFKGYLFLIESYEKLKSRISKEDRLKIKSSLFKKYGDVDLDNLYKEAKAISEEYKIYSLEDISNHLLDIPELLYDECDVEDTFSLVKYLEVGNEEILNDFYYIDKYDNSTLDNILLRVSKGFNENIFIDTKVFNSLKEELNNKIDDTKKVLLINQKIDDDNAKLFDKLEEALNFIQDIIKPDLPELHKKHKEFLDEYGVTDFDSIEDVLEKKFQIDYSIDLLFKVKKLIKIRVKSSEERNKKIIDSIKLRFLDAGHIEGSIQALITVVTENINKALNGRQEINGFLRKTSKHTNFLFSGDLGRIKDPNLSGKPETSDLKLDYIQMESTYAGRNHPDRIQSERDFFNAINKAHGKVVVPTFSMQRTQEILMLLLEEMIEKNSDKIELDELKKELQEVVTEYDLINDKSNARALELERSISLIKKDISEIKKSSFFQHIILDSPLSRKITTIYLTHLGKKYNLLDPEVQEKLFGRQVIEVITSKLQQEALYDTKRKNKKEVIISSSGMCEGGAVLSHLEENLGNKKSTIIFVGYTPPNCRGGKIKQKLPISIEGKVFDVKCSVVDIKGFSGHIDEEEILMYLSDTNINRGATLSLTHGTEARNKLGEKIQAEVLKNRKSIDIIIPKLSDTIDIKI